MIGNWKIYWFSGFMFLLSIFFVIPNLSNNLSDYTKDTKIFKSSRIDTEERKKGFSTIEIETLILTMQDGTEWEFAEQYSEYWNELSDTSNVGKRYTFYSGNIVGLNPSQVEIENKVVFNLKTLHTSKYIILLITLGGVIISLIDYRTYLKAKRKT